MFLLIDNSNENTKWVLADSDSIHWQSRATLPTSELIASGFPAQLLANHLDAIVYASVVSAGAQQIQALAQQLDRPAHALDANSPHGLALDHYPDPGSIGADRLSNAIASHHLHPDQAILTIDAGTATTLDASIPGPPRRFLGGLIAPGQSLLARALHTHTDRLPLVDITAKSTFPILATSTHDAIGGAITLGYPAMITALIQQLQEALKNHHPHPPALILTGGNSPTLAPHLPDATTIADLPLHGLHHFAKAIPN